MLKKKIFISSTQSEFKTQRLALYEYILSDPLLRKYFEPFLFELMPASDRKPNDVYLKEVERSDIYLGLLGREYGGVKKGLSPTEIEYNCASKHFKTRLLLLTNHKDEEREAKERKFITKVQKEVIRRRFSSIDELKIAVYAALVKYMETMEFLRALPFDADFCQNASWKDIDRKKVNTFINLARAKRGLPLTLSDSLNKVFTHLHLIDGKKRLVNAALLLFGKDPQKFFITSEIRCVHFYSNRVEKPISSYKVLKGSVFELIDQSVEFILQKLDYSIGTRTEHISIPGRYEIPKEIVTEAVVNAVAHRDYTSNASVQIMLFSDRLEIWNPGSLPIGWSVENLKQVHSSIPANPLLAEPMYLAGYIERIGTGTSDMEKWSKENGLPVPIFKQEDDFRVVLYKMPNSQGKEPNSQGKEPNSQGKEPNSQGKEPNSQGKERKNIFLQMFGFDKVPQRANASQIKKWILAICSSDYATLKELSLILERNQVFLQQNYISPMLNEGLLKLKYPNSKNSPKQAYIKAR